MKTNIKGLVRTLDLRHAHGPLPLLEAVSNAMDAVADKGNGLTNGRISIHLIRSIDLAVQARYRPDLGSAKAMIPKSYAGRGAVTPPATPPGPES